VSKILVIEPERILQQAMAIALYDHDVELMDAISESLNVKEFEALIVDLGSLRRRSRLGGHGLNTIQSWKLPTIWIDGDDSAAPPGRGEAGILREPVSREELLGALSKCLKPSALKTEAAELEAGSTRMKEAKFAAGGTSESAKLIELVDVIEEQAEKGSKSEKN
jgi:hypothetical protein